MPALVTREQAPVEQTWNLGDIYATPEDWATDTRRLDGDIAAVSLYQGRLGEGAATLLACLRARDILNERLQRLGTYARLSASADGASARNQGMAATANALGASVDRALSFVEAELLALPDGTVEAYVRDEPDLEMYHPLLENVLRRRQHMLAPAQHVLQQRVIHLQVRLVAHVCLDRTVGQRQQLGLDKRQRSIHRSSERISGRGHTLVARRGAIGRGAEPRVRAQALQAFIQYIARP